MFNDKDILDAISSRFQKEIDSFLDKDKIVIEANAHIEKMIEYDLIDKEKLQNHITDTITESTEISYFKGLQDGAKMMHTLISGNCVKEVMQTWGVYTENKYLSEVNIKSHYYNIKNGYKNGVKIDG